MDWGVPIGLALLFAVLVGWGLRDAEDAVAQLHLERADLDHVGIASDGPGAQLANRDGYAIRLVLENGEAIGVIEGTPLTWSVDSAGDHFSFGATRYEIVAGRRRMARAPRER